VPHPSLRPQRRRSTLRFGALSLVLLWLATLPLQIVAAQPVASAPAPTRKILVDARDQATQRELAQIGARLLVDYGAFALWRVPSVASTAALARPGVDAADMFDQIALRDGAIDTRPGAAAASGALRAQRSAGAQFWMVQFVGPIKDVWLQQLRGAGLQLVMYMPSNAYVVWGDAAALARLDTLAASSPFIQWTGPYQPEYRLAPSLKQAAAPSATVSMVDVTVQLFTTATTDQTLAQLRALGGRIDRQPARVGDLTNISLQLPASQVAVVSAWPDVFNVEPWVAPHLLDEAQGQIVAGNLTSVGGKRVPSGPGYLSWLASKGFPTTPASYPLVDVVDDGIDQGNASDVLHPDFHELGQAANPDRVAYIGNCTADSTSASIGGHGNLNAGIVGAYNNRSGAPHVDANGYRIGLGISPYGRIGGTRMFSSVGLFDISRCGNTEQGLVAASYAAGAVLTSDSWGSDLKGAYDSFAQAYDALTRDASSTTPGNQQMLHIFAAGNVGPGTSTLDSPGTAKNVLTVGATEGVRDNGVVDGCGLSAADNADDMAAFSSRGPTVDQRVKPDIVAPGTHIQGPASQASGYDGTGVCGANQDNNTSTIEPYYPAGQTLYTWSTGTSHSTPAVAGAAALAYEYYGRVLAPGHTPSPAMLKALLLNSPRYLNGAGTGDTLPSNNQGWGDVDLGQLFDNTQRSLLDQSVIFDASGQERQLAGSVADPAKPLRVTLVWTDAPGSTTGGASVNDLDLEVTVGGKVYKGNVFSGAFSTTGGAFDPRNNVENVFLSAGATGTFAVRVIARNIAGDGVPGVGDSTDQDFALVISNGTVAPTPFLSATATRWNDAAGNNDGVIDPGEAIALQVDLTNSGTATATGVHGTAQVLGGNATLINAAATYPDIPAGATRTNSPDYRFLVSPAQQCGGTITISTTAGYNGTQSLAQALTARVGATVLGAVAQYAYGGPAVGVPDNDPAGATIAIDVPAAGTVGDIDVHFSAIHTFDSDLVITLISPSGTQVVLSDQNGAAGDNYTNTIFDDQAATPIGAGTAPFSGRFRPDSALSALAGEPISGAWKLHVVDVEAPDPGTVTQFSLDIRPQTYVCHSVSADTISGLTADNNSPTALGSTTTLAAHVLTGTNVTYTWSFGDGQVGAGATVGHVYAAPGVYTAVVTATNTLGSASASTVVFAGRPAFLPIVVMAAPPG